jgi:hypothetical protein
VQVGLQVPGVEDVGVQDGQNLWPVRKSVARKVRVSLVVWKSRRRWQRVVRGWGDGAAVLLGAMMIMSWCVSRRTVCVGSESEEFWIE